MENSLRPMTGCLTLVVLCLVASVSGRTMTITAQDGPVSVTYGHVYKKGDLKIELDDFTKLPPLPAGFVAMNNQGYKISTSATVSGPHKIFFNATSVKEEDAFRSLRIFHAEPDTFDPDALVWVDRTILTPDAEPPNFSTRIITASSEELGLFVIGKLVNKVAPNTAVADLEVTCDSFPKQVTAPNNVTYAVKVINKGPQTATDVGMIDALPTAAVLVSSNVSQGSCKERSGNLYCKLGMLTSGSSAVLTLVVKPYEGAGSFPPEGKMIANLALVGAKQKDSNLHNNSASDSTRLFPDPNLPPNITIDDPKSGSLLVGPADVAIEATATDRDGTISKVEFFDNGTLVGPGSSIDGKHFLLTEQKASFGTHSLWALATDNGGRQSTSKTVIIIVNGSATVSILSPANETVITPGANVSLTTKANHPSGIISKVEFFANEESLGEGTASGPDGYTLRWEKIRPAVYSVYAVATDGSGVATRSAPITIRVGTPPKVTIVSPKEGARFPERTNLIIRVEATQPEGEIRKIDFYANDKLIGTANDIGTDQFLFTWRHVSEGSYSLTAVATDELGITNKSAPVKIILNNQFKNHRH